MQLSCPTFVGLAAIEGSIGRAPTRTADTMPTNRLQVRLALTAVVLATSEAFQVPFAVKEMQQSTISSRPRFSQGVVRLCASDEKLEPSEISGLYASLKQRRTELSSRASTIERERELILALADESSEAEVAQKKLWQHWYGEEGDKATDLLVAAEGDEKALTKLMAEYPDWVEPANRLATLRYLNGDFADSVTLCLRILRNKPWHFGASSGIVMCYAKLASQSNVLRRDAYIEEANKWALEAMPQPGPRREEWVKLMLERVDAKLDELSEI